MGKFIDTEGNEVEAFTQAELDAKIDETKKAIEGEYAPKLESVQKDLDDTKVALSKLQNKDFNFRKLEELNDEERKKLSAQELELMQRQEKLEKEQEDFRKQSEEAIIKRKMDTETRLFKKYVGTDKELGEKVKFHYDRLTDKAETEEEIEKKLQDAIRLARPELKVDPLTAAISSSGSYPANAQKELSEDQKDLANKLNLKL